MRVDGEVRGALVRSRGTRLLEDQLERADARSWQIADRYTMTSSAARRVAVRDFRVRFAVESQLVPQLCASREMGADTVRRSKESAHEPLMVLALLPQTVRSIC